MPTEPDALVELARSAEHRFWPKVKKSGSENGCWEWTAASIGRGYGVLRFVSAGATNNGRNLLAHRVSWMLAFGAIPDGLNVLHDCDNPPCVRPDHLFLGTTKDNADDMVSKGRSVQQKHPDRMPRGERFWSAKMTEDGVREMRRLYAEGARQVALAAQFGVNQAAVSAIVRRKVWKHVP